MDKCREVLHRFYAPWFHYPSNHDELKENWQETNVQHDGKRISLTANDKQPVKN